ncbi:hypothetical protein [[Kitasatospora] papulosa]
MAWLMPGRASSTSRRGDGHGHGKGGTDVAADVVQSLVVTT